MTEKIKDQKIKIRVSREMAVRMNQRAFELLDERTKDAFMAVFCHKEADIYSHLFWNRNVVQNRCDEAWRLIEDFIDFICDDAKGAFLEYVEISYDGGVKTYSNRTSSGFSSLLEVGPTVWFKGLPVSAYYSKEESEEW
jgi:hypothetical protein